MWSFLFTFLSFVAGLFVEHNEAVLKAILDLTPDMFDALVASAFALLLGWVSAWKQTQNRNDAVKTGTVANPLTGEKKPAKFQW